MNNKIIEKIILILFLFILLILFCGNIDNTIKILTNSFSGKYGNYVEIKGECIGEYLEYNKLTGAYDYLYIKGEENYYKLKIPIHLNEKEGFGYFNLLVDINELPIYENIDDNGYTTRIDKFKNNETVPMKITIREKYLKEISKENIHEKETRELMYYEEFIKYVEEENKPYLSKLLDKLDNKEKKIIKYN